MASDARSMPVDAAVEAFVAACGFRPNVVWVNEFVEPEEGREWPEFLRGVGSIHCLAKKGGEDGEVS